MKKTMKILALILALVMCFGVLAACGNKTAETPSNTPQTEQKPSEEKPAEPAKEEKPVEEEKVDATPKKVAVIFKLQDSYDVWLKQEFQKKAEAYGYHLDAFDFEDDETKFLQIMENVSLSGYDLVVARTPKMDARNAIKAVQDSGAIYFHISSQGWEYIRDEGLAQGMICNEYALGKIIAERAAEELPENANIVVLLGPAGKQNSIDRNQAFHDVMAEKRPDVTFLDEQIANWSKDEAMKKMDDWQQTFEKIDGVLACADCLAVGAIESLITAGFDDWDNMYIYGINGLNDACDYLSKGYLRASALQDSRQYANDVMDLFKQACDGTYDMKEPHWYEFQPSLIDQDNVAEMIEYYKTVGMM